MGKGLPAIDSQMGSRVGVGGRIGHPTRNPLCWPGNGTGTGVTAFCWLERSSCLVNANDLSHGIPPSPAPHSEGSSFSEYPHTPSLRPSPLGQLSPVAEIRNGT